MSVFFLIIINAFHCIFNLFSSPSEKLWGVQLCASNGAVCAKAAHTLMECGIEYDFVDLNMGCPLDPIYRQVLLFKVKVIRTNVTILMPGPTFNL